MPESGGSKHTEVGPAGASGQRKRRAGGGAGQELPGRVMVMAAADDVVLVEQGHGAHAILQLGPHEVALSDLWCVSFFDVVFV